MKKLLLTISTFIYLMVSTGIAMDIHYCMNERVGAELFANTNEKCCRCGMTEKETGCCHDEHKFYKLEIPGKQVNSCVSCDFGKQVLFVLPQIFKFELSPKLSVINFCKRSVVVSDYKPPRLYIFQCVYRL